MASILWLVANFFRPFTEPQVDAHNPANETTNDTLPATPVIVREAYVVGPGESRPATQQSSSTNARILLPQHAQNEERSGESGTEPPGVANADVFVGFLQRTAELWARRQTLEDEAGGINEAIAELLWLLDCRVGELRKVTAKSDPRLNDLTWELEEEAQELRALLNGETGLLHELERLNASMSLVKVEQNLVFKKISQAGQRLIDQSLSTGTIGALRVSSRLCGGLKEVAEDLLQTEVAQIECRVAWREYRASETQLQTALREPRDRERELEELKTVKTRLYGRAKKVQQMHSIRVRTLQQRRDTFVRERVVPVLSEAGLLDQTIISPSHLPPARGGSDGSVSPINQDNAKGPTRPDQQAALKLFATCSKNYQAHCDALEKFEDAYRRSKITHLTTYTDGNLENFDEAYRQRNSETYENLRARGEKSIRTARAQLDRAIDRVVAAGLEVPAMPESELETTPFSEADRRKIRKHLRDVARGRSPRGSPAAANVPPGNPVRPADWASANSGDPGRVAMIRGHEPSKVAVRLEAIRERRKKLREVWLSRMRHSKRAYALQSPHSVPKIDPWWDQSDPEITTQEATKENP